MESIFGPRIDATTFSLRPCLPTHWPNAGITLRRGEKVMRFVLLRGAGDAGPNLPDRAAPDGGGMVRCPFACEVQGLPSTLALSDA